LRKPGMGKRQSKYAERRQKEARRNSKKEVKGKDGNGPTHEQIEIKVKQEGGQMSYVLMRELVGVVFRHALVFESTAAPPI